MKKYLLCLIALFILSTSMSFAQFEKNQQLIQALRQNNVRVIALCNFQGTNNVLDIVTSNRTPGYELTSLGLAKLQDSIPILVPQNITFIYTAPAFRAQQSTNLLGKALSLTPFQLALDARLGMQNFGTAEGMNYTLYKELYTSEADMLENTPPGGESGQSVFNRAQSILQDISSLKNETVLVITHAFNFCHIAKCLTGKFGNVPTPGTCVTYDFTSSSNDVELNTLFE